MISYVTVAIPYVNSSPHLGYAFELVEADIFARSLRASGERVRFLGGTDDYSLKNVLAAETVGISTREFVDVHAARFAALAGPLDLSFDDFIRTSSDQRHAPAVERLWRACLAADDLYQQPYTGHYCVGCEQFYDIEELPDRRCPEHHVPLETISETNWFFRLSRYQARLIELISTGTVNVEPAAFRDEVLSFLHGGLRDISVSRSVSRARGWGIPVPDDPTQVIYVWFDALTNYISALGYGSPDTNDYRTWWTESDRRVHFIGKGILRFHAVYWPAFLLSAGQPLPTQIHVHPYLSLNGAKMSKSSGATIDPVELASLYGTDALRWWLFRDVAHTTDTDFTTDRLIQRANEDLANGIGNTVHRILTLAHRHRGGNVPGTRAPPLSALAGLPSEVQGLLALPNRRAAAQAINDAIVLLNRDLETTQPWTVAKDPARADELDEILDSYLKSADHIAASITPIVPEPSRELRRQLDRTATLTAPSPAFRRIEPTS
jgi:methionyl-tRNA synthetase